MMMDIITNVINTQCAFHDHMYLWHIILKPYRHQFNHYTKCIYDKKITTFLKQLMKYVYYVDLQQCSFKASCACFALVTKHFVILQ